MDETLTKTVTTRDGEVTSVVNTSAPAKATSYQTAEYTIYFFFGVVEVLMAIRLVLQVLGASLGSDFVRFIYNLSGIFIMPFQGMFPSSVVQGTQTNSVFDPSTIIAILVYALLAWGIVQLMHLFSGKKQPVELDQ